jgi:hypothetical protein
MLKNNLCCYRTFSFSLLFMLWLIATSTAYGQGSGFTYQGRLTDSANPADGVFDMQFKLFNLVSGGSQQGPTLTNSSVQVTNGVFAVELDFGEGVFDGAELFLEISIRPAGSPNPRTILSPRQPLTSAPYAFRSAIAREADQAANAERLDGIASSGFIKNTATQQAGTNFNIGGNGTLGGTLSANIVNAATRYDIGGSRVLSIGGTNNLFAGVGAGAANTSGNSNSFFGTNAGNANQTGFNNSFFGHNAGLMNTGNANSFFGEGAGNNNTSGFGNSYFGVLAGGINQTGGGNSFFGGNAGFMNTANNNSFFGFLAGRSNTSGSGNAFFGNNAGEANQTGGSNSFFGANAGDSNTSGTQNSFFGASAGQLNTASDNSFFGANAGNANTTGNQNSFFGISAGQLNQTGSNNSFFGVNAGKVNTASNNSFFGYLAGFSNTSGTQNSFFGISAGQFNQTGFGNSFFGNQAGDTNVNGNSNTIIGALADVGSDTLSFATAIGAGAVVNDSNSVVLGRPADTVRIPGSLNITTLGAATATQLCINAGLVSNCSSSLRYKDHLAPFTAGLELINRLRPITFNWKQSGERDLGLAAEEVAAVEPLLVTYNERGQVEGVKYDRINIALINAVREQQQQIVDKDEQIKSLQRQNRAFEARLRAIEGKLAADKTAHRRPAQSKKP